MAVVSEYFAFECTKYHITFFFSLGGDFQTNIVEKYKNGTFSTLSQRIIVGRSRSACVSVPKNYIRHLGFDCT